MYTFTGPLKKTATLQVLSGFQKFFFNIMPQRHIFIVKVVLSWNLVLNLGHTLIWFHFTKEECLVIQIIPVKL